MASLILIFAWSLVGCTAPQATQATINIEILADGKAITVILPAGSTVQQALDKAELSLNALDQTQPPIYTVLSEAAMVRLIRVTEKFEVEQIIIPFEQQTLRNESLSKETEIIIQVGQNGLNEITYRRVYEDGEEISSQPIPVKSVIIKEPVPEIRMIGIQAPFAPVAIPGRLYYLRDGNVWMVERTTGNRQAVLTLGDLDGRVFAISTDGTWLLFTRRGNENGQINSLWAANIPGLGLEEGAETEQYLIDLQVDNIIHFADFVPGSNTKVVFSTVEPRSAAPGWQANNDLNILTFSTSGWTTKWSIILEPNSGGVYGWWGTSYVWDPDGQHLAYTQPSGIGIVTFKDGSVQSVLEITPYLTHGDWAWVPGITWGPDGKVLYTVDHVFPPGSSSPEESQLFDLTAVPLEAGPALHIASQTGMFTYPQASPLQTHQSGEISYQIAFLQAIFANQSESSRYRLAVMDRDGSDRKVIFPPSESAGIDPQRHWGAWSPLPIPETGNYAIALIYQGNLWLIDVTTGESFQITGDGLTTRVIWK